ncbi:hypothetical protein EIN_409980 [Entamoeba invadens IP1]|uniref:Rab-GAP TBC domain-containing protein n=1 Tax=Entamoeba invadens IP1 TaxID=370355 RepID=A0A0A1TWQ9_ENTIV|nr:hypothetical protein EIN_409980 [Entamoeba invadens IP1]ELP85679.1 hypothetical protein EIN_409980 [Entamoeba invadens IP1]|eukprot:XP_004185025.1 hypothetical protein EIN_409980 [Entamoeba invadens IP1]
MEHHQEEVIHKRDLKIQKETRDTEIMRDPLAISQTFLDRLQEEDGSLREVDEMNLRTKMKYNGCNEDCRLVVWEIVAGLRKLSTNKSEWEERQKSMQEEYITYKDLWKNGDQSSMDKDTLDFYLKNKDIITKDVLRTDRDVAMFKDVKSEETKILHDVITTFCISQKVVYGQGMNDILSILMEVTTEDYLLYYLFQFTLSLVHDIYGGNGPISTEKMKGVGVIIEVVDPELGEFFETMRLTFEFIARWLLMLFKREFKRNLVLRLWDAFFAFPDERLFMFVAAALMVENRDNFLRAAPSFDEIYIWTINNENKIPLDVLFSADSLLTKFKKTATEEQKAIVFVK